MNPLTITLLFEVLKELLVPLIKKILLAEHTKLSGPAKKQHALDALQPFISQAAQHYALQPYEEQTIKKILSFLIDLLILILNNFFGKTWLNEVQDISNTNKPSTD